MAETSVEPDLNFKAVESLDEQGKAIFVNEILPEAGAALAAVARLEREMYGPNINKEAREKLRLEKDTLLRELGGKTVQALARELEYKLTE